VLRPFGASAGDDEVWDQRTCLGATLGDKCKRERNRIYARCDLRYDEAQFDWAALQVAERVCKVKRDDLCKLFGVALKNEMISQHRRRRPELPIDEIPPGQQPIGEPDREGQCIRRIAEELSDEENKLLLLKRKGFDGDEIAAELQILRNAVDQRWSRLRKKIITRKTARCSDLFDDQ
jgi:hypothetical protein